MSDELLATSWAGPLLWVVLYSSDYYLTIACARMYQAQNVIVFEGSYEITPAFQSDVNALRLLSPRFLIYLVVTTSVLVLIRVVAGSVEVYLMFLGAFILIEATLHVRHLRNWFQFSHALKFAKGRVEYPRHVVLRASAHEFLVFAVVYAGLFVVTKHPFILGGTFACALLAIGHYNLAKQARSADAA